MLGAELCAEEPARGAKLTDDVLEAMLDRGYIIGKNGVNRNVLAFQPPLVIDEADVRGMLDALEASLAELV